MPKESKPKPIETVEEFNQVVDGIIIKTQEADAIKLRLERALARVRARYDAKLKPINAVITAQFKRASKFAVLKRKELFLKDVKSASTALAEFGFAFGKPTLALLDDCTWEDVEAAIQVKIKELKEQLLETCDQEASDELDKWEALLSVKTELSKENIKNTLTKEERAAIGTEIKKTESFWLDAKKEKTAQPSVGDVVEGEEVA